MVIEFADPGIDWTPVFWALGLLGLGLVLFALPFALPDRKFQDWMPAPGALVAVAGLLWAGTAAIAIPSGEYPRVVGELKSSALEAEGFTDVTLNGNRFTASDDGEYFRGVLIDLKPESGYRYQVSEIVDR